MGHLSFCDFFPKSESGCTHILFAFTLESKKKGRIESIRPKLKTELGLLRRSALFSHLRLFAGRSIFVDHALCGSMINRADGRQIRFFGYGRVPGLQRFIKAADSRLHLRLSRAIIQRLLRGDFDTLHGGLDICQNNSPPISVSHFIRTEVSLAYHRG